MSNCHSLDACIGRNGRFTSHAVSLGGALVRGDINSVLDAEGAECVLNGLYLAVGCQHMDNHTFIDHAKPNGSSREFYKGILAGASHGVFNGKIRVRKDAQKTDARHTNKNLLLSEAALVDTKPQLEIHADDVKYTHGATSGQLDEEALFYLRSRGIGEEQARSLLVHAFASDASLFQTTTAERGTLEATVGATGSVRARQSAVLVWETSGTVEKVNANVGDQVSRDDVLASLAMSSLSQNVILAEADLASAQKALDDLLNSDTARAQALRTLDKAEEDYKKAYDYRLSLNGKIDIADVYLERGVPRVRYYKGYADKETIADADEKLALAEAQLNDARRAYDRIKDGSDPADVAATQARESAPG